MTEVFAARSARSSRTTTGRSVVKHGQLEIGVLHRDGELYAYNNHCIHQGGPACEGMMMAKVEDVMQPDKTVTGQRFNHDEMHFCRSGTAWSTT